MASSIPCLDVKLLANLENSSDMLAWRYVGTELPANTTLVFHWLFCVTGSDTAKQEQ